MSLFDKIIKKNPAISPIETEPIVAFRCWNVKESPEEVLGLYSVVQDFQWPPYEAAKGDLSRKWGGIYAFKSPDDVSSYLTNGGIAGQVYLWGEVHEHAEGFRAEFAYPKELWVPKDYDPTMIMRLEETYGVPVVIKEDLFSKTQTLLASAWGATAANTASGSPMKFTSGIQYGVMEVLCDVIYDREALKDSRQHLFCLPLGMVTHELDGRPKIKSYQETNMVMSASLQAPDRFIIKAIRCVFLESDGRPVPIHDPIYWEATVTLRLNSKQYWHSLASYVADPAILMCGTDWSKIPDEERGKLINWGKSLVCANSAIPGTNGQLSTNIEGIEIQQQQCFQVIIDGTDKWKGKREVLCALEGICSRAVL